MLEISVQDDGSVTLSGRLDASQCDKALEVLDGLSGPTDVDCSSLEYISSAGLGILLKTQKRLMAEGGALRLVAVSNHINDVFRYSGFDQIFQIETAG